MEAIQLSKEQKDKLLEMCIALFPELKNLEVRDSMEDFCFDFEHICVEFNRESELKIIHWFEFCMTHLVNKLNMSFCDMGNLISSLNGDEETDMFGIHPVDYLYKEFKKIK